jgi:uncharacterized protein (TIGR02996 family)
VDRALAARLLAEITANPDDDGPRLVYGDALSEAGDPRGELILRQLAGQATEELLSRHENAWTTELRGLGVEKVEWRRGFVEGVTLELDAFLQGGDALFRAAPVLRVKLTGCGRQELPRLLTSPLLGRVRGLDLGENALDAAAVAALVEAPHARELRELLLANNDILDAGARAIARSRLKKLERLELAGNLIEDEGAEALADSATLYALCDLGVAGNSITPRGVRALATPADYRLAALDLGHNAVALAGAMALAQAPASSKLRRLGLASAQIGPAAALALSLSPQLAGLEALGLAGNPLGAEGLANLRASPFLSRRLLDVIAP